MLSHGIIEKTRPKETLHQGHDGVARRPSYNGGLDQGRRVEQC